MGFVFLWLGLVAVLEGTSDRLAHFNFCLQTHPLAFRDGRTPLKVAIDNDHAAVVAFLRSVGAEE